MRDGGPGAQPSNVPLTGTQQGALEAAGVRADRHAYDVELPGLGGYRVEAVPVSDGATVLVGIPTAEVSKALSTLILVEVCVTGAGLVAAGIAASPTTGSRSHIRSPIPQQAADAAAGT